MLCTVCHQQQTPGLQFHLCHSCAAAIADQQACDRPQNPSLIVCPSTLVPHWAYEIGKFVAPGLIRPLQYQGTPKERQLQQPLLLKHNVLVASYEAVKADVTWLTQHTWLYCILDEGHIIRNPKSRISQVSTLPSFKTLDQSRSEVQWQTIRMECCFSALGKCMRICLIGTETGW